MRRALAISSPRPSTARVSKPVSKALRPERTRAAFPLLRGGGQGRGRTADLPLFRDSIVLIGQVTKGPCCPAQRHLRWSLGTSAIVSTVPGYAAEFRFVCGIPVGSPPEREVVGILWGSRTVAANPANPPRANRHAERRGPALERRRVPGPCGIGRFQPLAGGAGRTLNGVPVSLSFLSRARAGGRARDQRSPCWRRRQRSSSRPMNPGRVWVPAGRPRAARRLLPGALPVAGARPVMRR